MRSVLVAVLIVGCGPSELPPSSDPDDCQMCTDPDAFECMGCLGDPSSPEPNVGPDATVDQIPITESSLSFGIIGDTRPASVNDTAGYPTAIITQIFQDLQATSPRP